MPWGKGGEKVQRRPDLSQKNVPVNIVRTKYAAEDTQTKRLPVVVAVVVVVV